MHRRLEPQLMDDYDQAKAFANANKQKSIDFFLECKNTYFPNLLFYESLDLCCGPAEYAIALADNNFGIVDAVDASEPMLEIAHNNVKKTAVHSRINLKHIHVPFITDKKYDFIFSVNSLHHFHNPRDFWLTVKAHTKHKTKILVIDLYRPETEVLANSIVNYYTENEDEIFKKDFYNSLLAAFNTKEICEQLGDAELNLNVEKIPTTFSGNYMNVIWGEV